MYATSGNNRVAIRINTPALGDTIAAIPTLRKLSQAYDNKRLTVFSSKPFLFEGHPLVSEAKDLSESTDGYKVYNTFNQLVGKSYQLDGEHVEFRYSNMDLRQFHAVSLGFTLTEAEMEMDLYIEKERKLPFEDYVIIHPTHTWPTRTWAREKWQALVDKLNQAGIPVVAVGRDSKETGNYNTEKPVMDINIKLGLNLLNDPDNGPAELRWMMNNQARAVVTMDSGILHLAGTTDVNIIQLSSSIDYRLRAPYRNGSQSYKYRYVDGGCEMCSSDMASNIKVHGSIHGVPPQVKCLKDKHFDECHPTVEQVYNEVISLKGKHDNLYDKAFITHCDENYIPIVEKMIESVKLFSDLPVITYVLNSSAQVKGADKTIRLDFTVRDGDQFLEGDQFINRKSHKVYDIITKKVDVLEHTLQNIAAHVVYLDGDSVATNNIESLFNYTNQQHPMFTQGINEIMLMDGAGNPFDAAKPDFSKTLEYPLCELLDIEQEHHHRFPLGYVQTGYISAIKSNLPFIKEWKALCEMDDVKSNPNKYAPFHEETIVNVLLWKYNYKERMPLVYVNAQNTERVRETYAAEFNTKQKVTHKGPWFALPPKVEDIAAFHGAKDAKEIDKMIETIKGQKKRVVYLTPHLSTGGMPQFVLTRLEALIEQGHYDVHLIEYNQYSATYTVQRDKIVELLGSNFHTVAYLNEITHEERGTRVKELLEELNPAVVHLDECPESFDDFNRMDIAFTDWLYSHQRPWHIVETCHNIWFNGNKKRWQPDAYAFCSPHHPGNNFKDNPGYKEVIEYPITNAKPEAHQKLAAKEQLEMDPDRVHILNVGLWTQGKNQSEGVNIARIINKTCPGKYQFHFVGNQASNFKEYWQPILEDLPENVKVWGERNDTHLFYQAADAFMFNSTWECNPLAIREAIGYGLITFTRNLPQYLDMFTPYIIPLENDLSENANIILSHLESAEKLTPDYKQPEGEMERFGAEHVDFYKHVETLDRQEQPKGPVKLRLEYQGSTKLHVDAIDDAEWFADFIENDEIIYRTPKLKEGHWYMPNQKWWTDWQVKYYRNGQFYHEEHLSLMDQEVLVSFSSSSLGDTLSWMGQMLRYKEIKGIKKLFVRTHKNWLFDKEWYKERGIELIDDWQTKRQYQVNIGVFYDEETPWKRNEHKNDWRQQPLGKIATDILGINYIEERPQMAPQFLKAKAIKQKQIVIATASTAQAKYWNNPNGWHDLTQWHLNQGYKVLHASKEGGGPEGSEQLSEALDEVATEINSAQYFVGISSGLSWFAWALGAKVVLISGFTPEWIEFKKNCLRIINKNGCWGCWSFNTFNRGDWNWCPSHKGTKRQFECTKQIEASDIIVEILKKEWDKP